MTHLQWISILFIVITHKFTSIATSNDQDESQKVIAMYENAICKVNNELNNVIINKLLTIMKLEALEKKRFSQMGKSGCNKKSKKSSSMKDRELIENKIFVQIFDRNQTSVESGRQQLGIEQQASPKIDIGKLNWTDANFDKTLSSIDFGKITAEELNKILDQSLKKSNCPSGSFFEEGKGCVSIDTFSVVPSTPNTIDIEAIFNQPLKAFSDLKPKGKVVNGDMKIETESVAENAENLLRLILKLKSNGTSSLDTGYIANLTMGDLSNLLSQVWGEMGVSGISEKPGPDSFVDEGEIANTGRSIKSQVLKPAVDSFGSGEIMMNKAEPTIKMLSSLPDELNSKIMQKLKLEVDGIERHVQQKMKITNATDDAIVVEPQIIKETIPIKMKLKPSEIGEVSNSFQPFKISLPFQFIQTSQGNENAEINYPASGKKQENVLISFGNFGKAVSEQLAEHIGAGYELNEHKLSVTSEAEFATKAPEPKTKPKARKTQQAFFVHELPLISRKSLVNDAIGTTEVPKSTKQVSTAASSTQVPSTKPSRVISHLIQAGLNSGEEIVKTKKKILSNFFPKLFDGRRFASTVVSPDKENVNQIRKNVSPPKITFETVEGKTLSDDLTKDNETTTEGLQLKVKKEENVAGEVLAKEVKKEADAKSTKDQSEEKTDENTKEIDFKDKVKATTEVHRSYDLTTAHEDVVSAPKVCQKGYRFDAQGCSKSQL